MKLIKYRVLFILFITCMLISFIINATGDDDEGEEGEEGGFASALGSGAVGFLAIGSIYVGAARLNEYTKPTKIKSDNEQMSEIPESKDEVKVNQNGIDDWKVMYRSLYKQYRKPLLYIHNGAMITATVIAGIHGILLLEEGEGRTTTGIVALSLMVILSILGSIMFFKFKPIWSKRGTRKLTRLVHQQLILSIILVIALIIHAE